MALTPNFLQPDLKPLNLTRKRIGLGIGMGLGFAFALYCFMYTSREAIRKMSSTDYYDLWIMTDTEISFYNFFFALVALIFGQSLCIDFLFHRPGAKLYRRHRKTSILNDQRVLNWYFLFWFAKLSVGYGIVMGMVFHNGWNYFNFFPDHWYLFPLIVVTLFLHSWTTLRLVYKRWSLRWMLGSAVVLTVLALGLSRVNLVDYNAINEAFLENNTHHNYQVDIPFSEEYGGSTSRRYLEVIDIVFRKEDNDFKEPLLLYFGKEISLDSLAKSIAGSQSGHNDFEDMYTKYKLNVHKEVSMGYVNEVHAVLQKIGIKRLEYGVHPGGKIAESYEYAYRDFSFRALNFALDTTIFDYDFLRDQFAEIKKFDPVIILDHKEGTGFFVNENLVHRDSLEAEMQAAILGKSNFAVQYVINSNSSFDDYLKIKVTLRKVQNSIYEYHSKNEEGMPYKKLPFDKKKELRSNHFFPVFELMEEHKELLE